MVYIRFPLSLRQVEDFLDERRIEICHEAVRTRWNRFGPMFAVEIRRKRSASMCVNGGAKRDQRSGVKIDH